ncbi:MAG: homoserine dehydrogenase, partial [Chloroflexota bacterium]
MDVRLALTGFGNVGQGLATLLTKYGDRYQREYGVRPVLTGIADRGGAVTAPQGLDPETLLEAKRATGTVASLPEGTPGMHGEQFLDRADARVLIEVASTNFVDAEPGWSYIRGAFARDMDVVLASKGSLALHYGAVMREAASKGRRVLFSATVGAPVPSLQIAERGLTGAGTLGFEGILNGTTHQILTAMAGGATYDEGVRQAQ